MHPATTADWKLVDGTLRGFAITQCQLDSEIGRWLIAAQRTKPWEKCGMRSLWEYAERLFPWSAQTVSERLRTAKALEELPQLDAELASGRMNFSVVRELTRVAVPETEAEWIEAMSLQTAREVEQKVARHVKGERPDDPGDVSRVKKRMTLSFSADQWAIVSSALALMRKHDATLTDEEGFRLMASAAVDSIKSQSPEGAVPPRPFRLQVEIGLDGKSFLKGVGEDRHEISPALAECAQCDAEVWIRRPDGTIHRVRTAIPQPMRRLLHEKANGRCELCRIRLDPQLHHLWLVSEGGQHDVEQMIVLCPSHHDRVHEGSLWITGSRSQGFTFTMADGAPYGSGAPSKKAEINIEAFQGLRGLGFQEKEIRPVLEALHDRALPIEELLREALKALGRRKPAPTWERPAARAGATAANPARATATEPGAAREAEAASTASPGATTDAGAMNDAFGSLRGLGFTEAEIRPVLLELRSRDLALPGLLRESLKILGGGKSSPTWERPVSPPRERQQSRKYRMHPPETEGAAERETPYARIAMSERPFRMRWRRSMSTERRRSDSTLRRANTGRAGAVSMTHGVSLRSAVRQRDLESKKARTFPSGPL